MALQLFKKAKQLEFERSYSVPLATAWNAWTEPVTITKIGPKAKMAAFGMKWGYKAQLDKLDQLLGSS